MSSSKQSANLAPSPCVCMNLRRASRAITRIYDRALEPSGLKVTQYSLLKNIEAYGPLNVSALAGLVALDRTTLVRNLKPLESAGLVEEVEGCDPRERQLGVTGLGRETIEVALPLWKQAQRQMSEQLGADRLGVLGQMVGVLEGRGYGRG